MRAGWRDSFFLQCEVDCEQGVVECYLWVVAKDVNCKSDSTACNVSD